MYWNSKNRYALIAGALMCGVVVFAGCGPSSEIDPRCSIQAEGPHRRQLAKSVNASNLWKEFFKQKQPSKSGASPLVEFTFTVKRSAHRSGGGDYDRGTIAVDFKAKSTANGRLLYKNDMEVRLQEFMIGVFDKDATREQVQEIAFKATEEKVYPYLDRWVAISAIRAMGNEGSAGSRFVSTLDELVESSWTAGDLRAAAEEALRSIKG